MTESAPSYVRTKRKTAAHRQPAPVSVSHAGKLQIILTALLFAAYAAAAGYSYLYSPYLLRELAAAGLVAGMAYIIKRYKTVSARRITLQASAN